MEWHFIVALGLAVPIVLFPVAFGFYLNAGQVLSIVAAFRKRLGTRRGISELVPEDAQVSIMRTGNIIKERCKT